ncbi:chondroitin sulfate proteoglycan 4 [Oryzias melastigma]|uniref:Chondroitin sulfate proteoglycan 4 n=1 Tax=Oryzias melastigma TaxID=30732 RepID=A0A3B3D4A9_ORYME|nr:chondroitin sulfate proteoglycan 4 [Oryzias melastigma]
MRLLIGAFLAVLLSLPGPCHGDSYFGDSFCKLQLFQDISTFDLSLQIKTSRRSGLLLLAAGIEDYLFLELLNGKLQARMNMGADEIILTSPDGVQLNNLLDHKLSLILGDGRLTMTIDDTFETFVDVNIDGVLLNIDQGVWLGGTGDLDATYLSNAIPPFRGCMTDIKFVSHQFDILGSVFKECQDTKESCSSEFEENDGEATSFSTPDSFVSFPTWSELAGATRTLEFLMKTTIEDALLVFHPGRESDFIAVGVVKGYLKGILDVGNGIVMLDNTEVQLDDDQWHRVKVEVSQNSFALVVDSQSSSHSFDSTAKLDLVGNLYVGGIQGKMKDLFRESGSLSRFEDDLTSESFIGCLNEIKVNQRDRNLQDALVTKDVHVKCEGDDYDYSSYYDPDMVTTSPPDHITYTTVSLNEEQCHPTENVPEIFKNITKLLATAPLLVPDGGEAFLDITNLNPTFDLRAAGMQPSQIIFTLLTDPLFGLVDINTNIQGTKKFTLQHVLDRKIKYMHDGNVLDTDQINLEVVPNSNNILPECLKAPHKLGLPVKIQEERRREINIVENGRTRMSVTDFDLENYDDLEILVGSTEFGYFGNGKEPGKKISDFTSRDLRDGNIFFVHEGGSPFEIPVMMSDSYSVSLNFYYKFIPIQPRITVANENAPITLAYNRQASLGTQNMAILPYPQNGDILFKVTQPPKFGELKIRASDGWYKQVTRFYQSDLEKDHIRYVGKNIDHLDKTEEDKILFEASLGQTSLSNQVLSVIITPQEETMPELELKVGEEKHIGIKELDIFLSDTNSDPNSFRYIVVKPPRLGSLQLSGKELSERDNFTHKDLLDNNVSFRAPQIDETSLDHFVLIVLSEGRYSPLHRFTVNILARKDDITMTNEKLVVVRGGEQTLDKGYLWLQSPTSSSFLYRVTKEPMYGRLIRDSLPGEARFEGAIRVFSNEDILNNRLIYKHDGSRTHSDEFHFSATGEGSHGVETVDGVVKISIQLKNEHSPVRIVDKVFKVVRRGQRLLTTDVIQFKDEDMGFSDSGIVFAREGILSGNIVSASNPLQHIFRFTQADLRDKKILFLHHGADVDRFEIQVSDGIHKTTALLEIQAGDPYLHVVNNTMVEVDNDATQTIDTTHLSADSNMDIRDYSEIKFQITSPPNHGNVVVSGIEATEFTQEDLRKGVVSYTHYGESQRPSDSFNFTVQAKGLSEKGTFRIKINQLSYSVPEVVANEVIINFGGEHTKIDSNLLKVQAGDFAPTELQYSVKQFPRLGHVANLTTSSDGMVLTPISSFTQDDIDQGLIVYVSLTDQGVDTFMVDVESDYGMLRNVKMNVEIVPHMIPVQAFNFSVKEGFSREINADVLNISHSFYSSKNIEFVVEASPQHGDIRYQDGYQLNYFSWREIMSGDIFYVHDSSETTEDSFTVTASCPEIRRRSLPVTIAVTIIPVNSQPPMLIRNAGLEIRAGDTAEITSSMLSAEDEDTPPEELVYNIEMLSHGRVALKEKPGMDIRNFTQADINEERVIFIDEGEEKSRLSFTVTDGEHTSPLYQFEITVKPATSTPVTHEKLLMFPGTRQQITISNLEPVSNGDGREARFSLVRSPRLGRLILANRKNQFEEINSFSQSQLEAGAVYYEHQLPAEPFWLVKDELEFRVESEPPRDTHHILPIDISFYAVHSNITSQLWRNTGLEVVQGQRKTIDKSILDASNLLTLIPESEERDVLYMIKRFPDHGRITLGGQDLSHNTQSFTQEDVSQGRVEYLHDDSRGPSDSFSFRARLKLERGGVPHRAENIILEEVFQISVKRRGSEPPELVTTDVLLEVPQGSRTVINQEYLNTQDEDSPPDEVRFKVTKAPTNGRFYNIRTMEPISEFTQEMVNNNQVAFYSDNSLRNGFVEFVVTDGEHETERFTLHIGILAHTLYLHQAQEIRVKQGDDETLVTEEMLKGTTNGPTEEAILYKITNVPKYAAIMVDRQPTSAFTQKLIREGRVSVRFVKSTSPQDTVSFTARSRIANVSSVLNITVQPLANIAQDPLLPQGALIQLDKRLLDATPLANKTRTTPTFTITQQPKGGRFLKPGGQPLESFSQKDLDEGRVTLEIDNPSEKGSGPNQDEAHFLLKAHGVPPAECVLSFQTGPYNSSGLYPVTLLRVPGGFSHNTPRTPRLRGDMDWAWTTASSASDSHVKPITRRSSIWSILIPILVVLLLLLLAAIVVYYLVHKNKTGKHNVQTASSKPKNGEVAGTETFRKTDPANNISMSNMDSKDADPELLQHCRTSNPASKKNQYWV